MMAKSKRTESIDETTCDESGQFAYERLDRTLHERARLGIMTSLISHPKGILFPHLKTLCDLTDGNLKRHLDVLCEEGLIEMSKESNGNRTQTLYRLLPKGKKRFLAYLEELQRVLDDASQGAKSATNLKPAVRRAYQ